MQLGCLLWLHLNTVTIEYPLSFHSIKDLFFFFLNVTISSSGPDSVLIVLCCICMQETEICLLDKLATLTIYGQHAQKICSHVTMV